MSDSNPKALFAYVTEQLNQFGLAYLHIIEPRVKGNVVIAEGQASPFSTIASAVSGSKPPAAMILPLNIFRSCSDATAQALTAKTVADGNGYKAQERGRFDKDFATVEQVRMPVLEVRVGEDAVQEEQHRCGKDEIVQASPKRTADASTEQRREEYEQQKIERRGAGKVEFWLQRGLDREEDVEQTEAGLIEEEKDDRIPLVKREEIHVSMRPALQRAVAHREEHAEP